MRNAVFCKNVKIGGGAGISIQSMTNTDTCDLEATLRQIESLQEAGADIVRLAVPDAAAGKALYNPRRHTEMPLVADIHFDYKLALTAIDAICQYFQKHEITGIVPKNTNSCCKRVCMFLRWMVRKGSPVDIGIWSELIDRRTLIMPLDTHVIQQAMQLGLLKSKSATMVAARRLTEELATFFPEDPLKADFALFGYGVNL